MGIYIDYETVCVNCKAKGYNFGYSFKTIEYNGNIALDMPQRHLNGATIIFDYLKKPILLHCLENAHQTSKVSEKPVFCMINAKRSRDDTINRFTYLYQPENDPNLSNLKGKRIVEDSQLYFYLDIYQPLDVPYFLMYYTFKLHGEIPFTNFSFYQIYDFDIYGEDNYEYDIGQFDEEQKVIYQYDSEAGEKESLYAGIGSVPKVNPDRFEANHPEEILVDKKRKYLRNKSEHGPDDCAVGLQWELDKLEPYRVESFPVFMVFGEGRKDFYNNVKKARDHLQKIYPTIFKVINDKYRQIIDPRLEEMSFSMREWCK